MKAKSSHLSGFLSIIFVNFSWKVERVVWPLIVEGFTDTTSLISVKVQLSTEEKKVVILFKAVIFQRLIFRLLYEKNNLSKRKSYLLTVPLVWPLSR